MKVYRTRGPFDGLMVVTGILFAYIDGRKWLMTWLRNVYENFTEKGWFKGGLMDLEKVEPKLTGLKLWNSSGFAY